MPVRSVDGGGDPIRVSAENSRLAGSTDLANSVQKDLRSEIVAAHKAMRPPGKGGPAEKAFYPALEHPVLIVYLLDIKGEEEVNAKDGAKAKLDRKKVHSNMCSPRQCVVHRGSRACPGCTGCPDCASMTSADPTVEVSFEEVGVLAAIKVAIPGDPLDSSTAGDATYVINTVAQRRWLVEAPPLDTDNPTEDEIDLDE